MINLVKLFTSLFVFFLIDSGRRLGTLGSCELIRCAHSVGMVQSMSDMSNPFFFRAVLEIDGNTSWRDGGGATRLD